MKEAVYKSNGQDVMLRWDVLQFDLQRMFSGLSDLAPLPSGKKIHGLPSRREPAFSIGWENQPQLNHYQLKHAKNQELTAKITNNQPLTKAQQVPTPLQPSTPLQPKEYERIFYENPNMSEEELEKLMAEYEQYRGSVPSRSSKQESSGGSERRVPIRPRESMKDILYNGVGVGEALPRRNSSNYQPESYNYPRRN